MANRTTRKMAVDLRLQWEAAILGQQKRGSAADDKYEQECYDRLIEHVEANGLNYTVYDPRGPKEMDPDYE
jgi:hypothetical protein